MVAEIMASIMSTLKIMGLMGIVLFLLATVNTVCSTVYNVSGKKEKFSFKRLFGGIGKTLVFFASSVLLGVAFTLIPFVNEIISGVFGQALVSEDVLQSLSGVGVFGVCLAVIINQGKKALVGIQKLGQGSTGKEEEGE